MDFILIASSLCETSGFLKALEMIRAIIKLTVVMVPLFLIIKSIIDIGKTLIMGYPEELLVQFVTVLKRLGICVLVFFTPYFGRMFISVLEDITSPFSHHYNTCIENIDNISYYEELEEMERQEKEEDFDKKVTEEKEEIQKREFEITLTSATAFDTNVSATTPTSADGTTFVGQRYDLSDSELKGIAYLCQKEQGSAAGAAAEASLMANRYELFGSRYGTDAHGLYNYVRNVGWWHNAASYMSQGSNVNADVLASVKQVIVLGARTLPNYVDEHDCIKCGRYGYDIKKLNVDGKIVTDHSGLLDKSNYIQGKTIIYNRYDAIYTFWSFPTETSDPFGYTSRAYEKVQGTASRAITFGR